MIQECPLFKKHYIFWVDDETGDKEAQNILDALEHKNLFNASIAVGVYSSLQILDAIKNRKKLPQFDLAVIDFRLGTSQSYFSAIESIKETAPQPLGIGNPYEDNAGELKLIERYSKEDAFNFIYSEVKDEIERNNNGGLFVWAWAMQVCNEAKYIIYSANDMTTLKFWKMAGVLDICDKGKMFITQDASGSKSYFISKLTDVVGEKLRRGKVDSFVTEKLLEDNGTWTVMIGDGSEYKFENVPSVLAPLSVNTDFANRTIALSEEEASNTYLLASFFLPWAKDLLSLDPLKIQSAVKEIKAAYESQWRPATSIMREFCDNEKPLHPFIESTTRDQTIENLTKAKDAYKQLGIKRYLSSATAHSLESYLEKNTFEEWEKIKHSLELEINNNNGLKHYFELEAEKSVIGKSAFSVVVQKNGEEKEISTKWYADVDWIKKVVSIVLNNLTKSKAFADSTITPNVRITMNVVSSPPTMQIQIRDNGVGFDVSREKLLERGRGYSVFSDEAVSRRLRAYGRLFIESRGNKLEVGTKAESKSDLLTGEGTIVTFEIYLG